MYILYKYFYKNPVKIEIYRTCKLIQLKITQIGQIEKKYYPKCLFMILHFE